MDDAPRSGVAVVTGAGRGIGAAIADRLAADGMRVAIVDRDEEAALAQAAAIQRGGGQAMAVAVDVSDGPAVDVGIEKIATTLGPPSVLVNNAGVTRDNLLFRMTADDWETVISTHLRGAFLMSQATQAHMVRAKYGRIVNISSVSALGNRGQANYAAAKAGLQGFTKTLALELGAFGVTVNSVAPGFIVSDMTRATAKRVGQDWDAYLDDRVSQIPVRRAGQPSDVAGLVSYFCSEESGFVSGQVVYVAGGPKA